MRILGITIPDNKKLSYGLTTLYGVGMKTAEKVLSEAKVDPNKKPTELSEKEENEIRRIVEELNIEGNLKRQISANIKRLKDIKSYRGTRHQKALPGRGQRTKTNSRTRRGNVRKTMSSGRRKVEKT
ncbi:30S ribosomal protein S13 [Candidatus Nomurabacteria bacterium]|nr:30S ribosomal protein S13 [Candidatus Nomurabacteria bacterium]USN94958.1 MAG: 30S ribosomal protein S13 [Candidatus Nomurabacteria bacterium]